MNRPEEVPSRISAPRRDPHPVAKVGKALLNWLRAASLDALLVGILWFIGLELLHIRLAPLWAVVGGLSQFIPGIGGMLALIGPALSLLFTGPNWEEYGLLLGLYAVIVAIDQHAIQPLLLRKITRVPIWASIFVPILLGILIPFWGVLLAPPLLAVVFAFRKPKPPRGRGKAARAEL
jgi:predicted PurR-regulated permease PerM